MKSDTKSMNGKRVEDFKPRNLDKCICGHDWCFHKTLFLPRFWKKRNKTDGECMNCTCPTFKPQLGESQ